MVVQMVRVARTSLNRLWPVKGCGPGSHTNMMLFFTALFQVPKKPGRCRHRNALYCVSGFESCHVGGCSANSCLPTNQYEGSSKLKPCPSPSCEHIKLQKQLQSKAMSGVKPSNRAVWSNREGLSGYDQKARSRSGVHVDMQTIREKNGREVLSINEALNSFDQMGDPPSMEQVIHTLQICKRKKVLAHAKHMHAHMCHHGMEIQGELGSHLVQLFAECGCMSNAQRAFNRLAGQNEYCWTSLILGYAEYGDSQHSLDLYQKMKEDCVPPSKFTFMALLKACTKMKCAERGRKIHVEMSEKGFEEDLILRNCLVDMYVKCGSLVEAQEAFDQAPVRDVISWNTLIAGYAEHDRNEEALNCSQQMQLEGVSQNDLTFVNILKACRSLRALDRGRELHSEIAKEGYEGDLFVSSSLLDLYSKCGFLLEAQEVFDELSVRDVVMWTTLIAGYTEYGFDEEALNCLGKMQEEDVSPNVFTYLCSLKACCSLRAIDKGQEIHSGIIKKGFDRESFLGNMLVDMYAKCGLLADARKVFDSLLVRDVVSWNALLSGYAEQGLGEEVLNGFQKMQLDGMSPTTATLVCSLKACGSLEAMDKGRIIHLEVAQEGYERDAFVGSALVDMYAKCGSLGEAQDTFDNLPIQDLVSWTTLIAGYAEHGLGEEALNRLEQMQMEGLSPDAITLVCSLKACVSIRALDKGHELHADVIKRGLERNPFVGNCLVEMYANYSTFIESWEVFYKLPARDVVSWNSLIAGYAEQGLHKEVLDCFEQMQLEDVLPNAGTLICILKSCGSIEAIGRGQEIHTKIVENQLEGDLFIGNNLVDMYTKFGLLTEAREVFEELPMRDVFSWNALIGGYIDYGFGEESLDIFQQMQLEGVCTSPVTLVCSVKACGIVGNVDKGQELHNEIISKGFERDIFLGNSLVDMYAKCGSLPEAEDVLEKLPVRDSVSWTVLIAKLVEHGLNQEALRCLDHMQLEGVSPDIFTYVCSLKACMSMGDIQRSQELHTEIVKRGLDINLIIGNTLLDMYAKRGSLADAGVVFKKLSSRDVISWTALIAAYAEQWHDEEALHCLDQMQLDEVSPDAVTYVCSLKACGSMGIFQKGKEIHSDIVKKGFDGDSFIGNTLIDMYAKCGSLAEAQEVFDELLIRDAVSWNALCSGYVEAGLGDDALTCFKKMQQEGVSRDVVSWNTIILVYTEQGDSETALRSYVEMQEQGLAPDGMVYVNILKACGNAAAFETGKAIHAQLYRHGYEEIDVILSTAFVDMYSKCGNMYDAQQVFEAMPIKDIVAWNALLTGYARQGEIEHVLSLFERMRVEGIHPERVAFLSVLTVCCHAGLVDKAQKYFELMANGYRFTPTIEHYNCMVDLLGRAGQLNEAVVMLENMPFRPDFVVWSTMLAACQKWGDVELGRQAFKGAVNLDEENSAAFVLMSNISVDS